MEESRGQFALLSKFTNKTNLEKGFLQKNTRFKYLLNSPKLTLCLKNKRLRFHLSVISTGILHVASPEEYRISLQLVS
jgi:hypothetical protein